MESNHHNIATTQRSAVELHAHIVPNSCPARYHTASIRSGCVDASRGKWPQPRTLLSDRHAFVPLYFGLGFLLPPPSTIVIQCWTACCFISGYSSSNFQRTIVCCGGRTRTADLLVMGQLSYHCSTPRYRTTAFPSLVHCKLMVNYSVYIIV